MKLGLAGSLLRKRSRGLRVRLTISYVAGFTLLLAGLGILFRETLQYTLISDAHEILEEEWNALKGYLHIENNMPVWSYDKNDPEEVYYVQRLRRIFFLTDVNGVTLEASDLYKFIGIESVQEIKQILQRQKVEEFTRRDSEGYLYLIRNGLLIDSGKRYMLAIGRSLEQAERVVGQFTRYYFALVPLLILGVAIGGWYMAGRALRPLNDVASTAQSISGDTLGLRIPRRDADDELDHLIDRFNDMVDRLQNSFDQIRRFSIDVSHELRTPLTAIRGELEVALFTGKSPEHFREAITAAIEDVDQLSKVIRTLLHLSQAESGQVALARDPVDLARLTRDVFEQFQIPAELQDIRMEIECQPATVSGDRVQLERLLWNLLSNAFKYTKPGGAIRVSVHSSGDTVELEVADTGRGIAAEHLPHIFDRFYRVPDGHANPDRGLGLGLSFVAWIAKAHGARIHVESTPNIGTRFVVSFPAETPSLVFEPASDRIVT